MGGLTASLYLKSLIEDKINKKDFTATVYDKKDSQTEPKTKVTLVAGYLKGDKTELIVQKAVELGIISLS